MDFKNQYKTILSRFLSPPESQHTILKCPTSCYRPLPVTKYTKLGIVNNVIHHQYYPHDGSFVVVAKCEKKSEVLQFANVFWSLLKLISEVMMTMMTVFEPPLRHFQIIAQTL